MSDKLREALLREINKEYRQLDGWARQSDIEKAIDRALTEAKGQEEDWMQREIADGVAPGQMLLSHPPKRQRMP